MGLFWAFATFLLALLVGTGIWAFGMAILDPAGDNDQERC